jgi:hypothetical protein
MTYLRNEEEVLGDPVRGIAPKVFKLTEQHLRHLLLPKDPDEALTQAYHTQYTKWVPDDLRVLLMTDVLFPCYMGRKSSICCSYTVVCGTSTACKRNKSPCRSLGNCESMATRH